MHKRKPQQESRDGRAYYLISSKESRKAGKMSGKKKKKAKDKKKKRG